VLCSDLPLLALPFHCRVTLASLHDGMADMPGLSGFGIKGAAHGGAQGTGGEAHSGWDGGRCRHGIPC